MADDEIPKQRGTSSGEIGQNPVEISGKQCVPSPKEKPAYERKIEDDPSEEISDPVNKPTV
jgi:hypothetical protein